MNIFKKALKLNKEEFYIKHLLIINPMLPIQMTPKEAEVLAAFMSLEGDIARDPFGTSGRKIVRQRLGISAGGLGNYLRDLKIKNCILVREDESLLILPTLVPKDRKLQGYQFVLEMIENGA